MKILDRSAPVVPNQKLKTEAQKDSVSLVVSKPKFDISHFKFLERGLKYFGAGVAISNISSNIIIPFMNSGMDWCPVFPKPLYNYARNVCLVREYLPGLTDTYNILVFKAPIVEELLFRVGLQELILKRAPKVILNRFAPSNSSVVDSKIAKIARVAVTAAAFSLAHAIPPEAGLPQCSTARLVNNFVFGLILGGVQEVTESPLMGMLMHSGMNIQAAYFLKNIGAILECPSA